MVDRLRGKKSAGKPVSLERRTLLKGAAAIGAGLLTEKLSAPAVAQQREYVQIGSLSPLTGSNAPNGLFITQGQMLFEEQFNRAGGFKSGPEKGKFLKMIYEDDGEGTGTADTAISAFRKLVQVNGVKAVTGVVLSSVALPLAPIAQNAKCAFIAIDPTTPALTKFPHFFRITETSETGGPTYAGCVYNAGFRNINFIWINDPAGVGTHDKFIPKFKELGGNVILDISIAVGATDYKTEITRCMATKADCNVLLVHQGETLILMKQAHDLGYVDPKVQWFLSFYSEEMLQKGGPIFENTYAKRYHVPTETKEYQAFESAHHAKFGKDAQIAYFGMAAYDAMTALARAIEKNGYDYDGINAGLHGMEFQGVSKFIKFNMENGDNITTSQDVSQVKNGKYVTKFHYNPNAKT